jgi:hypothetical protein
MHTLNELSRPGVYSLEFNGYAYFGYSLDILVTVSKIISELRQGLFKVKDMEGKPLNLHVWEELSGGADIETLKLRCQYAARNWQGELWNPATKSLLGYTVITRVDMKRKCVNVLLKPSSSRVEKLVGVFSTKAEAEEFISVYYDSKRNPMMLPVFACNSRTSEERNRRIRGTL